MIWLNGSTSRGLQSCVTACTAAPSHEPTGTRDGGASEGPVRHLYLFVDTALPAQVEQAVTAAGMTIAPWLRAMVRQMTIDDFPASSRRGASAVLSQLDVEPLGTRAKATAVLATTRYA
jgi:hypothetical protein